MSVIENVGNYFANHTIIGRMVNNGDGFFEAVGNDLKEDTIIGQLTQDKSFLDALKDSRGGLLAGVVGNAAASIFLEE